MNSAGKKQSKSLIELKETGPDGQVKSLKFGHSPLLVVVNQCITELERMECLPNPGPHCESWYSEPCQFAGNECPAGKAVSAVIEATIRLQDDPGFSAFETLKNIANDPEFELTPELRSWALQGTLQLKAFLKTVEKRLKAESKETGPIMVGDTPYGWFTSKKSVVDKLVALDTMFRTMELADIAERVSISKTELGNIRKRKYGELGQQIIDLVVTEKDGPLEFGPMTNIAEV